MFMDGKLCSKRGKTFFLMFFLHQFLGKLFVLTKLLGSITLREGA